MAKRIITNLGVKNKFPTSVLDKTKITKDLKRCVTRLAGSKLDLLVPIVLDDWNISYDLVLTSTKSLRKLLNTDELSVNRSVLCTPYIEINIYKNSAVYSNIIDSRYIAAIPSGTYQSTDIINQAREWLKEHTSYSNFYISKILDPDNVTIYSNASGNSEIIQYKSYGPYESTMQVDIDANASSLEEIAEAIDRDCMEYLDNVVATFSVILIQAATSVTIKPFEINGNALGCQNPILLQVGKPVLSVIFIQQGFFTGQYTLSSDAYIINLPYLLKWGNPNATIEVTCTDGSSVIIYNLCPGVLGAKNTMLVNGKTYECSSIFLEINRVDIKDDSLPIDCPLKPYPRLHIKNISADDGGSDNTFEFTYIYKADLSQPVVDTTIGYVDITLNIKNRTPEILRLSNGNFNTGSNSISASIDGKVIQDGENYLNIITVLATTIINGLYYRGQPTDNGTLYYSDDTLESVTADATFFTAGVYDNKPAYLQGWSQLEESFIFKLYSFLENSTGSLQEKAYKLWIELDADSQSHLISTLKAADYDGTFIGDENRGYLYLTDFLECVTSPTEFPSEFFSESYEATIEDLLESALKDVTCTLFVENYTNSAIGITLLSSEFITVGNSCYDLENNQGSRDKWYENPYKGWVLTMPTTPQEVQPQETELNSWWVHISTSATTPTTGELWEGNRVFSMNLEDSNSFYVTAWFGPSNLYSNRLTGLPYTYTCIKDSTTSVKGTGNRCIISESGDWEISFTFGSYYSSPQVKVNLITSTSTTSGADAKKYTFGYYPEATEVYKLTNLIYIKTSLHSAPLSTTSSTYPQVFILNSTACAPDQAIWPSRIYCQTESTSKGFKPLSTPIVVVSNTYSDSSSIDLTNKTGSTCSWGVYQQGAALYKSSTTSNLSAMGLTWPLAGSNGAERFIDNSTNLGHGDIYIQSSPIRAFNKGWLPENLYIKLYIYIRNKDSHALSKFETLSYYPIQVIDANDTAYKGGKNLDAPIDITTDLLCTFGEFVGKTFKDSFANGCSILLITSTI